MAVGWQGMFIKILSKLWNLIMPHNKCTIRRGLVIYYSLLIVIILIAIVTINMVITTNVLKSNTSYYASQAIIKTREKIDAVLKQIEYYSKIIVYNKQFQKTLINLKNVGYNSNSWESLNMINNLHKMLADFYATMPEVYSIGIYFSEDDALFFKSSNYYDDKSRQVAIENSMKQLDIVRKKIMWVPNCRLDNNLSVFVLQRKIIETETLEEIAVLVLNIRTDYLNEVLGESIPSRPGSVYIISSEGEVISSINNYNNGNDMQFEDLTYTSVQRILEEEGGSFSSEINTKSVIINFDTSLSTGWKTVSIIPMEEINAPVIRNQLLLVIVGLIGFIFAFILSLIISASIVKPIKNLRNVMKEVSKGNFNATIEAGNFIETRELGEGFGKMLKDLNDMINKVYVHEIREKDAKFKALQSQINPHFLYNTLETINYILVIDEKYELSRVVTNLGDILRYSISGEKNTALLKDEIENIEKYLYIQKYRFGERLDYIIDISEEALGCIMLKLLIQPIVENAVVHGIEKKIGKGIIKILGTIEDNTLVISIQDNGIGIPLSTLSEVLDDKTDEGMYDKNTHLGIKNVNDRIKFYYGEQFGLKISSEEGKGTLVKIFIPAITRKELLNNEYTYC